MKCPVVSFRVSVFLGLCDGHGEAFGVEAFGDV